MKEICMQSWNARFSASRAASSKLSADTLYSLDSPSKSTTSTVNILLRKTFALLLCERLLSCNELS